MRLDITHERPASLAPQERRVAEVLGAAQALQVSSLLPHGIRSEFGRWTHHRGVMRGAARASRGM